MSKVTKVPARRDLAVSHFQPRLTQLRWTLPLIGAAFIASALLIALTQAVAR